VEESPKVETYWGYAGSASWNGENAPQYGFSVWDGEKTSPFVPIPGKDNFEAWTNKGSAQDATK
jgi:hypothetical protein